MDANQLPGQRIEVAPDPRALRGMALVIVGTWIVMSTIVLVPAVGVFLAGPRGIHPHRAAFPMLTAGAAALVGLLILEYRRAALFVLTTEGFWLPTIGGRFHHWNDVIDVQIHSYKGVPRMIIRTIRSREKIPVAFIKDRPALMAIIRAHVKRRSTPDPLPPGEDDGE